MNEDSLLAIITDVERFCEDHSLALFHCFDCPASLQNRIMWEKSDLAEIPKYLTAFLRSGSKMLHYYTYAFSIETFSDIKKAVTALPKEEQSADLLQKLWYLEKVAGLTMGLSLVFRAGDSVYSFGYSAPWEETVEELEMIGPEESDEDDDEDLEEIDAEELEKWARKLLANKTYLAAADERERRSAANRLLITKLDDRQEIFSIITRAELLYQAELQPKVDAAVLEKLQALKEETEAKGKKLTKAEAMRQLNLTLRQLNKYWG